MSRMSHEIRSPLCAVLNECDLRPFTHQRLVCTDLYIANDVLSLDKLKSDNMRVDSEPCDPEEVITSTIKRHRGKFKKKGLRLFFVDGQHAASSFFGQNKVYSDP